MRNFRPFAALPAPVRAFWFAYFAATLLCAAVMGTWRFLLHYKNPFRSPFFPEHAEQKYIDFFDFARRFTHFHQPDFFSLAPDRGSLFSYPPPMGLLYALFYLPAAHRYVVFTVVTVGLLGVLVVLMGRAMRRRGIGAGTTVLFLGSLALFSYPFWFNALLGNLEVCVFLLLAFGVVALLSGHVYLSAALIGIAGSMKLFPFILFGLLLSRRKYRPLAFGIVVAAATFVVAAWAECPSLPAARAGMGTGASAMGAGLILRWLPLENGFDQSLFSLYKTVLHPFQGDLFSAMALRTYVLIAATSGVLLYFLRIRKLPQLNQVLCLYIAAVLLPPMSHHYTLLHLYVPWALLTLYAIDHRRDGIPHAALLASFVLLALILAPQAEFIAHNVSLSGPIKAIELLLLGGICLKAPFAAPSHSTTARAERNFDTVTEPV